jgi:hypothetical protein
MVESAGKRQAERILHNRGFRQSPASSGRPSRVPTGLLTVPKANV